MGPCQSAHGMSVGETHDRKGQGFVSWVGMVRVTHRPKAPRCNGGDLPVPIGSYAYPLRRSDAWFSWELGTFAPSYPAMGGFSTFQGPLVQFFFLREGGGGGTCCPARVSGGETRLGDDCRVPPCKSARQANIAYHDSLQPICDADASKRPHSLGLGPRKPMCPL